MELLKHNQEAYEKVVEMFETENKVAVVHPTGTGKMYIALKWLLDNKDKKLLFLAPNSTIMYQFKKTLEDNGHSLSEFSNINFALYYQMLEWEEEDFEQYDCIVLDELHRAGALKWGNQVNNLLTINENSKVLGLTATPTRYMDKRNMVDELFEGNIASEMTLAEAMAKGVLPYPTYVSSIYSLEGELAKYQERINNTTDLEKKEKAQRVLDKVRNYASSAISIDEVLKKHITQKDGHYIIFCKDLENLEEIKCQLSNWFKDINSNMSVYDVHYQKKGSENEQTLKDFENNNDESIKILLSIDKLNEGLHLHNIDGVIMLRRTSSHIVYLQQLGRALSCNTIGKPLIIDFVNGLETYENLYDVRDAIINYYQGNGYNYSEQQFNALFKIYDYIENIMNSLKEIDDLYRISNDKKMLILKSYINEGNSYETIAMQRTMYGEYPIGKWVSNWRYLYNIGNLDPYVEAELRTLGETFEYKRSINKSDQEKLTIIKQFIASGKNYADIKKETKFNDHPLGTWQNNWRIAYRAGKLKKETESELRALGESFERRKRTDITEEQKIEVIKKFINEGHSYSDIKQKMLYGDYAIGQWVMQWRKQQKNQTIKPETEQILRNLGETFEVKKRNPVSDEKKIEIIKEYLSQEKTYGGIGHLEKYNEYPIGIWKNRWRNLYNKGKLSQELEQQLRLLGEDFTPKYEKIKVNYDIIDSKEFTLTKDSMIEQKGKSL